MTNDSAATCRWVAPLCATVDGAEPRDSSWRWYSSTFPASRPMCHVVGVTWQACVEVCPFSIPKLEEPVRLLITGRRSTAVCSRQQSSSFHRSTDIWATRRLGDRRLGDKFLDDHLRETGWTFRRQQLDVWAAMNICSGKGFSSRKSTSKTL